MESNSKQHTFPPSEQPRQSDVLDMDDFDNEQIRMAMEASKISVEEDEKRRRSLLLVPAVRTAKDPKILRLDESSSPATSQNESGFFERLNGDVVCSKAESSGSSNDREKQRMMISAYCPWTNKRNQVCGLFPLEKSKLHDRGKEVLIPTGPKFGPGNDISLEELTELCVNQFQQRDRQMWQEYNEKMKNNHGSHLLDRGKRVVLKAIKRDPSRNRKKMDRNEIGWDEAEVNDAVEAVSDSNNPISKGPEISESYPNTKEDSFPPITNQQQYGRRPINPRSTVRPQQKPMRTMAEALFDSTKLGLSNEPSSSASRKQRSLFNSNTANFRLIPEDQRNGYEMTDAEIAAFCIADLGKNLDQNISSESIGPDEVEVGEVSNSSSESEYEGVKSSKRVKVTNNNKVRAKRGRKAENESSVNKPTRGKGRGRGKKN